jgi:hypothetical protein
LLAVLVFCRYLFRVGLKRAKSLLTSGADTDLLESIIKLLTFNREGLVKEVAVNDPAVSMLPIETENATEQPDGSGEGPHEPAEGTTTTKASDRTDEELLTDARLRVKWLKAIADFDKFDLTRRFLSKELVVEVVSMLREYAGAVEDGDVLAARYQC